MKIELYINSESPEAGAIQAEVARELSAFHQLDNDIVITSTEFSRIKSHKLCHNTRYET